MQRSPLVRSTDLKNFLDDRSIFFWSQSESPVLFFLPRCKVKFFGQNVDLTNWGSSVLVYISHPKGNFPRDQTGSRILVLIALILIVPILSIGPLPPCSSWPPTAWPAGPQSPAMGHVLMSEYREVNNFPGDAYYGHYETKNMILM